MGKLDNKVVLVTGANRGIGRGIATAFAAEGASLALLARSASKLEEVVGEIREAGGEVLALGADVTDEEQVTQAFARTREHFGRLDILVNNAGTFEGGPLDQMPVEVWDKVIAVNLRGPFLCSREAMRLMKAQKGGRILNIGSISAKRVRMNSAPYSTSKHGLWGLTQATALEGRDFGISCSCLQAGNTRSEWRRDSNREADREPMMEVDELVQAALVMASLPPHVNMFEAVVLPVGQLYIGRG